MSNISVLDYGLGNVGSVIRMVEKVGGEAIKISTAEEVLQAKKIILPGVGNFDHGLSLLHTKKLIPALQTAVSKNNSTLLGICLGMQLLFDSSEEGNNPGLGLIKGKVIKFNDNEKKLRIPHMGWNEIDVRKPNPLIQLSKEEGVKSRFYFVHSYHAVCQDPRDVLATVHYGNDVTAAVSHGNIYGAQFHPEKSHSFGMNLIKRFMEL